MKSKNHTWTCGTHTCGGGSHPVQYPEKSSKSKLIKIHIAFEEPLLLHVGKEAHPEWITARNCHNCSAISHGRVTHINHKRVFSNPVAWTFLHSRGGGRHFFRLRLRSCSKIFESGSGSPGPAIFQIWESDSCSDSGYNHRSNRNLAMFLLKKWSHKLPLLPKLKSDGQIRVRFFPNFWLRVWKKNTVSYRSRLRYSGSGPTSAP